MNETPLTGPGERRLSEADARRLLERVIELDAGRVGDTSLEELRRVAQELNLSPAAFDQAVTELNNGALTPPPTPAEQERSGRYAGWARTAGIAVMSAAVTYIYSDEIFRYGDDDWAALLLTGSAALTLFHRIRRTPKAFWGDMVALWAASMWVYLNTGGAQTPEGSLGVDVEWLAALLVGWLATSTVGSWIVKFRWPWQKHTAPKNEFAATH